MSKNLAQLTTGAPPLFDDLMHTRRESGTPTDHKVTYLEVTANLPVPHLADRSVAVSDLVDDLMQISDGSDSFVNKKITTSRFLEGMPIANIDDDIMDPGDYFIRAHFGAGPFYTNKRVDYLTLTAKLPVSGLTVMTDHSTPATDLVMVKQGDDLMKVNRINFTAWLPIPSLANMGSLETNGNYRNYPIPVYNNDSGQLEYQTAEAMLISQPWYHLAAQAVPAAIDLFIFNDGNVNTKHTLTFAQLKAAILAP
jgi:hypothetical protein